MSGLQEFQKLVITNIVDDAKETTKNIDKFFEMFDIDMEEIDEHADIDQDDADMANVN